MPRQPFECQLQHDLGRAARPTAIALDIFKTAQKTAHIEQQAGKLWAAGFQRSPHILARCNHGVGDAAAKTGAAPPSGRRLPAGGDARHHLRARKIGTQPFASDELGWGDHGRTTAPLAARQPRQRALTIVDGDLLAARLTGDALRRQAEMLGAETVDLRLCSACDCSSRAAGLGHCPPPFWPPRLRDSVKLGNLTGNHEGGTVTGRSRSISSMGTSYGTIIP